VFRTEANESNMNRVLRTSLLAVLAAPLSLSAVPTLLAQDPGAKPETRQAAPEPEPTISIEFAGGSLRNFTDLVRQTPMHPNIVVSGQADAIQLPAISLQGASVEAALQSVGAIVPDPWDVGVRAMGHGERRVFTVVAGERHHVPPPQASASRPQGVRVFSLTKLISPLPIDSQDHPVAQTPETILSATQVAMELSQETEEKPVLRFHPESGLLLVKGTSQQIDAVEQVLRGIEANQGFERQAQMMAAGKGPEHTGERQEKIKEAK
jgi:hypothetical protein